MVRRQLRRLGRPTVEADVVDGAEEEDGASGAPWAHGALVAQGVALAPQKSGADSSVAA